MTKRYFPRDLDDHNRDQTPPGSPDARETDGNTDHRPPQARRADDGSNPKAQEV
jgi:hypothetical protein